MEQQRFFEMIYQRTGLELTLTQKQIITSQKPVIQVLATAGSGKTTTVVSKIGYLLAVDQVRANQILALTYSRSSAKDLKDRHMALLGQQVQAVNYSTLHAFAFSVLRRVYARKRQKLSLIDSEESTLNKYAMMADAYKKTNGSYATKEVLDELFSEISYVKNARIKPESYGAKTTAFLKLFTTYEKLKVEHGVIDFDDMLSNCLLVFEEHPEIVRILRDQYRYIVLDEAQDINCVQVELMKVLSKDAKQLIVIGDDDQSIYGFRAADPSYLISLVACHEDAVSYELGCNYRCPSNLVEEAKKLIVNNSHRLEKGIESSDQRQGIIERVPVIKSGAQYRFVLDGLIKESPEYLLDTAILFRNNYSMVPIIDLLIKAKLPIYIKEPVTTFMNHWVVKDIFMILDLIEDRYDLALLIRVLPKVRIFVTKEAKARISKSQLSGSAFDFLKNQLSGKARTALSDLVYEMNGCEHLEIPDKIERIVTLMGYGEYMNDRADRGNYGRSIPQTIVHGLKLILDGVSSTQQAREKLQSLVNEMEQLKYSKKGSGISLLTMHGAKGLEFDNLFLIDLADDIIPMKNTHFEDDLLEEERRLFYVAVTRARKQLKLIYPAHNPSRFILEMQGKPVKQAKHMLINAPKGKVHADFKRTGTFVTGYHELEEGLTIIHQVFGTGVINKIVKDDISLMFGDDIKVFSLELLVDGRLLKK
ncbi:MULTISPECIES: ATP-dependent helicase [unclassified Fusibacter]|uniref:ATP-dependent helicase n=1 Tax=unclassified Fusibacter TaxID=2624464 RepID=UPI001011B751|nr:MULTISPECIES: ATP-dependent helicase [unclassified Fusibacter]MCK8058653.1 ATP-dependent helicase [Fusibacter sp. A2]NPE21728.1 ATP-dependent helicase [Fusibacter sp. A1]RXV61302.1 ATP-dependent helicase [Fusibacter sp. A1]